MKRILLVPDIQNWVFDSIATAIQKYQTNILFDKKYIKELNKSDFEKYDLVHIMGWNCAKKWIGLKNLSTDVSSAWYKYRGDPEENYRMLKRFPHVFSKNTEFYNDIYPHNHNIQILPDAVDYDFFKLREGKPKNKKLRIGWVGNPETGNINESCSDIKGYNRILLPLIKYFSNNMVDIVPITNNYLNPFSREEIRNYYYNLDLFLCTSWSEGTPQTVLEAIACGIPVISTEVGIVNRIQNPLILKTVPVKENQQWRKSIDIIKDFIYHINMYLEDDCYISSRSLFETYYSWSENINDINLYFNNSIRGTHA